MDSTVIMHQMVQLFIVMGIGFILFRSGMIDRNFNRQASSLVLNCTMPATILSSVFAQMDNRNMNIVIQMFTISLLIYIILPLFGFVISKVMHVSEEEQGVYMFMSVFSNVGFMGFPIVASVFGEKAVFYAAILNIVFTVSSFTYGVFMINYGASNDGRKIFDWKKILTPGVILPIAAVFIYIAGIDFPEDAVRACSYVGSLTTPLAMLLIGSTLATMDIRSVISDRKIYIFTVIKQILLPVIIWTVMRSFVNDTTVLGVVTVLMLMPVANNSVLFTTIYGRDEKLAARGVFITTLFSMISVPLLMHVLM